jgi:hypothetical protein
MGLQAVSRLRGLASQGVHCEVASFAPSGAGIGGGLKRTTKRI